MEHESLKGLRHEREILASSMNYTLCTGYVVSPCDLLIMTDYMVRTHQQRRLDVLYDTRKVLSRHC